MVLQLFLCVFGHRFIKRYFILKLLSLFVPHPLYIFLLQKEATSSLGPFSLETVFPTLPFSKEKGAWDAVEKEIKNEGVFFMRIFYALALFRIFPLSFCPLCWLSVVTKKEKNLTYIFNRLN